MKEESDPIFDERQDLVDLARSEIRLSGGTRLMPQIRRLLSEAQVNRIKDKCRWEQMTWTGVLYDWPDLFIYDEDYY